MAVFEDPTWQKLEEVVASASERLLVCAPYVTRPGLDRVRNHVREGVTITILTRISIDSWVDGVCDPEAILDFMRFFDIREVGVSDRLHAKALIADDRIALVGSANLTRRAYAHNLEIQSSLDAHEVDQVANLITRWDASIRNLEIEEFNCWVTDHRNAVLEERRRLDDEEPGALDALSRAQEALDALAGGRAIERRPYREPDSHHLEDFVAWLDNHQEFAGATKILERNQNRLGDNLTGHVRQSFFASYLFFQDNNRLVPEAARLLEELAAGAISPLDEELIEAWVEHVESNAGTRTDLFSFPVLRGILPPSLGGTRQGGGGGSSTLKRILPLVARWLEDDR